MGSKKHGAYSTEGIKEQVGCDDGTMMLHLIRSYEKLLISHRRLHREVKNLSDRVEEISLKLSQTNG